MAAAVVLAALVCAPGAAAQHSVRVGPDYFGVNYPLWPHDSPDVRTRQLAAIRAAGIENVRIPLYWHALEGNEPTGGVHHYNWFTSDAQVAALASHGLRMMPVFFYPPPWASAENALTCPAGTFVSAAPDRLDDYAAAANALARRYGPDGAFWALNPTLPKLPITTWQLWNEPNLRSFWCPGPDASGYAELFVRGAAAIKSVDPAARVITAGLLIGSDGSRLIHPRDFAQRMTNTRGDIWRWADGAGAHLFPGGQLKDQFKQLSNLRADLSAAGVPKTEPLFGSEIGWGIEGFGINEAERAERYRFFTERLPSSNCNVSAMYAQSWTTTERGGAFHDNGTGIANRFSGDLLPSGAAYRDMVAVLRGVGPREAIHPNLRHCDGMPKLDRDGDGRAEHRDYHPLDPARWEGPPGWDRTLVLDATAPQPLGKPVKIEASCGDLCTLVARGTIRLRGIKGKLRLKRARAKSLAGAPVEMKLKPDRRTLKKIRRARARKGVARISLVATDLDGELQTASTKVALRGRAKRGPRR